MDYSDKHKKEPERYNPTTFNPYTSSFFRSLHSSVAMNPAENIADNTQARILPFIPITWMNLISI